MSKIVYPVTLGLGTNVGLRLGHLTRAIRALSPQINHLRVSRIYQSDAMLKPNAPASWNQPFYNCAVSGFTKMPPQKLLLFIKRIETQIGRSPFHGIWSPRLIDIDIFTHGSKPFKNRSLTIPHVAITQRAFAIEPLLEIAPKTLLRYTPRQTAISLYNNKIPRYGTHATRIRLPL